MAEWKTEMEIATREMPDSLEAVINSMTDAQLGRLDQVAKDHLSNKEAVREAKPEVPE